MQTVNRIRSLREATGLTQRALSIKAGLPQSTVCNLEKGNVSPRVDSLSKLARALNADLSELLVV